MRTSDTLAKIAPALVKAAAEIEGAAKSANNTHFRSKYATLESVIDATKEALAKHDLCVVQAPGHMEGNLLTMTTRLIHTSGEWIEAEYQIPLVKCDPQASGSAITYARRYALMALLNVPAVDDDGEAAMDRKPTPPADKLTPEQVKDLADLIKSSGTKPDVVLKYYGVDAINDIPRTAFDTLKAKLSGRVPQQRKAA